MNKIFAITCHKLTQPLIHTVTYFASFEENIVLIHVDKKTNIEDFLFLKGNNVHFIENRINILWGNVSQIISTIELMKYSLKYEYEYFFLLSGDDIPLKSNEELNNFLYKNSKYEFIHYQDGKTSYINPEDRVKYNYPLFFFLKKKTLYIRLKKFFVYTFKDVFYKNKLFYDHKINIPKLYKGTNWFGLKKSTIIYILEYIYNNPWFLDLFEKSICGDEVFFHSIIKTNSEIIIFDNPNYGHKALRYIDWVSGPEFPKILNEEDISNMRKSNYFFARKVHEDAKDSFMKSFLKDFIL